jgi:hypothetical protein
MRRLCDEGVRSYLGRSRLAGESPTALPQREVSRGRSSADSQSRTYRLDCQIQLLA